MINKIIFSISVIGLLFAISCKKNDSKTATPPRDVTEVRNENNAAIEKFLKTHSYTFSPTATISETVVFTTTSNTAAAIFNNTNLKHLELDVYDANNQRVRHKLYYMILQEGAGMTTTIADSVYVNYKGQLLDLSVFDKTETQSLSYWMDLIGNIVTQRPAGTIKGFTAQIVVIPISLYYFHQFSILFFISNLVVVPLLQPILILGILCLLLASTVGLPNIIIFITEKLIWLMNTVIRLIAEQEFFIIRNIQFNTLTLIVSLLIVISIIWWRHYLHQKAVKAILISIFILQVVLFYNKYQLSTTEEMLIFSKYKEKVIVIRQGQRLKVFQNDTLSLSPILKNYIKQKGITDISLLKMPYLLHFKEKNYLLMDSLGIYPTSKQVVIDSVIFVQQTPKINLDRMKQDLSLRY